MDVAGQDSTEAFEDIGHSDEAREILDGLFIGNLKRAVSSPLFSDHEWTHADPSSSLATLRPPPPLPALPPRPPSPMRPAWASASTPSSSSAVSWATSATSTCRRNSSSSRWCTGEPPSGGDSNALRGRPGLHARRGNSEKKQNTRKSQKHKDIEIPWGWSGFSVYLGDTQRLFERGGLADFAGDSSSAGRQRRIG